MRKNNLYILNGLKNKNRGSTLLEVIVSVFLLTFGILALMAAQLRSVSSVSEAENRTIVAQAAESLMEGMQAYPSGLERSGGKLIKTYKAYEEDSSSFKGSGQAAWQGNVSNGNLAKWHLADFNNALDSKMNNISGYEWKVCPDIEQPKEPSIGNNGKVSNWNCNSSGSGMAIKVAWTMKSEDKNNSSVSFSYVLRVTD